VSIEAMVTRHQCFRPFKEVRMARTCQQELLLRQALAGLPRSDARRTGSQRALADGEE
jgi:hypothetical protein